MRDFVLDLRQRQGHAHVTDPFHPFRAQGHVNHLLLQGRALPKRHAKPLWTLGRPQDFRTRAVILKSGWIVPGRLGQDAVRRCR